MGTNTRIPTTPTKNGQPTRAADAMTIAEQLVGRGKLREAISVYVQFLARHSSYPDSQIQNRLGDLYAKAGDIEQAVRTYEALLSRTLEWARPAPSGKADRDLTFNEKYDRSVMAAISILKKIVRLNPVHQSALTQLAELYEAQRLTVEAARQWSALAEYCASINDHDRAGYYRSRAAEALAPKPKARPVKHPKVADDGISSKNEGDLDDSERGGMEPLSEESDDAEFGRLKAAMLDEAVTAAVKRLDAAAALHQHSDLQDAYADTDPADTEPFTAEDFLNPLGSLATDGMPAVRTVNDLLVFLCHVAEDKALVRQLYSSLRVEPFQLWFDEEDLLPGQDWQLEIMRAVRRSHVVLICLSSRSVNKTGYVQKEIRTALDVLAEQPEGIIFVIPVRLEPCEVPHSLRHLHYVDIFDHRGFHKLRRALVARAVQLNFI